MKEIMEQLRDLTSETVNCHWTFVVDKYGYFRLTFYRAGKNVIFKSKEDYELCFRNAIEYIKQNRKPLDAEVGFKL